MITERLVPENYELLVVAAPGQTLPATLEKGAWVVVRGTVRRFDRAQLDLGSSLPASVVQAWEGRPVLIAQSVAAIAP